MQRALALLGGGLGQATYCKVYSLQASTQASTGEVLQEGVTLARGWDICEDRQMRDNGRSGQFLLLGSEGRSTPKQGRDIARTSAQTMVSCPGVQKRRKHRNSRSLRDSLRYVNDSRAFASVNLGGHGQARQAAAGWISSSTPKSLTE